MTKTKSLLIACAALATSLAAVVPPAIARPMMHHKHMMMHKKMMMHHKMKMMHHHRMMHRM